MGSLLPQWVKLAAMITVLHVMIALFIDFLFGEPRRWHPLAGFGRLAARLEVWLYGPGGLSRAARRFRGLLAWGVAVLPFVALTLYLGTIPYLDHLAAVLLLYLAIGRKSLAQHARAVARVLRQGDIAEARRRVAMMISRETGKMDETAVSRAAIESVLENGSDAIFAALFWFLLLGAPGVVLYRLSNTLDAMWGYRTPRYRDFGWAAARLDDALNWIPARLTALAYALVGNTRLAWRCWRTQANQWEGENPGAVIATGAGALQLSLGGPAVYHGMRKSRPWLGAGAPPSAAHIEQSVRFVQRALWLWLGVIMIGGWMIA